MLLKSLKTVTVAVVLTGSLVGLTACSNGSDNNNNSTETKTSTSTTKTTAPVSDKTDIAATYKKFLTGTFSLDAAKSKAVLKDAAKLSDKSTDADFKTFSAKAKDLAPETFALIDTEGYTAKQQAAVYAGFAYLGSALSEANKTYTFEIPESAVTVKGDTATIDTKQLVAKANGVKVDTNNTATSSVPQFTFVKKGGKWLLHLPESALSE